MPKSVQYEYRDVEENRFLILVCSHNPLVDYLIREHSLSAMLF